MELKNSWPRKKLSRAVQLAVLSMSVAPSIALADVQLDEGSGAAASALTTITNTATINPAADYLNVDGANTQLTGGVTNSGTITAEFDAFEVRDTSTITGMSLMGAVRTKAMAAQSTSDGSSKRDDLTTTEYQSSTSVWGLWCRVGCAD